MPAPPGASLAPRELGIDYLVAAHRHTARVPSDADRVEQAIERLHEAQRLQASGFGARAVEALHAAAELAVEEWAEREGVTVPPADVSPHETRARLAVPLRHAGRVPAGFDKLLRRLNEDRKRTKYDGKPTRFDAMTLAQAEASVRLVVESLGGNDRPAPVETAAPVGAPVQERRPARRRLPLLAIAAVAGVALVAVLAIAVAGGGDDGPTPAEQRPEVRGRPVAAGRPGVVRGLTYRVTRTHTGTTLTRGGGERRARGIFAVAYVSVRNPSTDTILPLRLDAFALQTSGGRLVRPAIRVEDLPLAVDASGNTSLSLPFDVPRDELRGARLVVDEVSPSGRTREPGIAIALDLADGIGPIKPGTWTGRTRDGRALTMRVDNGEVVRRITVEGRTAAGAPCEARFSAIYFVDGTELAPPGPLEVRGRFRTATEAAGEVATAPSAACRVDRTPWSASTRLP
jgi:hypothetical protein